MVIELNKKVVNIFFQIFNEINKDCKPNEIKSFVTFYSFF